MAVVWAIICRIARDISTAQRRTASLFPETHCQGLIGIEPSLTVQTGKAKQVLPSILHSTLSDQQPGRLGSQRHTGDQEGEPHPLQSPGKTVRPFGLVVELRFDDPDSDDLTDSPAEVATNARGGPYDVSESENCQTPKFCSTHT